jgi:hypothetical protein
LQEISPDYDEDDCEEANVLVRSLARDVEGGESKTVVVVGQASRAPRQ